MGYDLISLAFIAVTIVAILAIIGANVALITRHVVIMEIQLGQARRSKMTNPKQLFIAAVTGLLALGATSASASYQPDICDVGHDHRSHAANYYDYYPADQYSRAGPYRDQGVRFSITIGDRYDRRADYSDRGRRNGYRGRDGRVVNKQVFDTRHRARIVLIEEAVRTRRGPRLVCTVEARGPEARYVSERRLRRIARDNCSPRARIKVFA